MKDKKEQPTKKTSTKHQAAATKMGQMVSENTKAIEQARAELGNGLVDELILRFGPLLAERLLRWIMGRRSAMVKAEGLSPADTQALPGTDILMKFIASLLVSHKEDIRRLLHDKVDELLDLLVDTLED